MRKSAALLLAVMLLLGGAAWGEIEFGAGLTPLTGEGDSSGSENNSGDFFQNSYITLHLGYRLLGIFYLSGDYITIPPNIAKGMTSYYDEVNDTWVEGINRPAIISAYDAGLKLVIGKLDFTLQAGLNKFYIYKQSELENFSPPDFGVNLKLGVGLKLFKFMGLEISVLSVQPSFQDAIDVVKGVFDTDTATQSDAVDKLLKQIVPLLQLVIYL